MHTPDIAEDHNYTCTEMCDECGSEQSGTMHHCNDAMGWATPVFWQCARCANPPVLVGLVRSVKRFAIRKYNKARYLATTTKSDRAKRRAHVESVKARINARRAAAGEALIGEAR